MTPKKRAPEDPEDLLVGGASLMAAAIKSHRTQAEALGASVVFLNSGSTIFGSNVSLRENCVSTSPIHFNSVANLFFG
jgi:hypothetical protein